MHGMSMSALHVTSTRDVAFHAHLLWCPFVSATCAFIHAQPCVVYLQHMIWRNIHRHASKSSKILYCSTSSSSLLKKAFPNSISFDSKKSFISHRYSPSYEYTQSHIESSNDTDFIAFVVIYISPATSG